MKDFILVQEYNVEHKQSFNHAINRNCILQVISMPPETITEKNPTTCVMTLMVSGQPQNLMIIDSYESVVAQLNGSPIESAN